MVFSILSPFPITTPYSDKAGSDYAQYISTYLLNPKFIEKSIFRIANLCLCEKEV